MQLRPKELRLRLHWWVLLKHLIFLLQIRPPSIAMSLMRPSRVWKAKGRQNLTRYLKIGIPVATMPVYHDLVTQPSALSTFVWQQFKLSEEIHPSEKEKKKKKNGCWDVTDTNRFKTTDAVCRPRLVTLCVVGPGLSIRWVWVWDSMMYKFFSSLDKQNKN